MISHIFCPKCGYQRTEKDDPSIPQGKCPSCEVYYAKYFSQQSAPKPEPAKQKKAEQPKAKVRTHYDNLKVARDVSTSDIQAAYDALVDAYHPDKHPDNKDSAEKVMKVVQAAYEGLIDPIKKAKHDAWIREQEGTPFSAADECLLAEKGIISLISKKIRIQRLIQIFLSAFALASKVSLKSIIKKSKSNRITILKYSAGISFAAFIFFVDNPVSAYVLGHSLFSKEISGSVFIKTKGGDNIKLGLVDIYVIPLSKNEASQTQAIINLKKLRAIELRDTYDYVGRSKIREKYEKYHQMFMSFFSLHEKREEIVRSTTDADGRFNFRLRKGIEYLLTAEASRKLFDSSEYYKWAIIIDTNYSEELLLSNHTMIDND